MRFKYRRCELRLNGLDQFRSESEYWITLLISLPWQPNLPLSIQEDEWTTGNILTGQQSSLHFLLATVLTSNTYVAWMVHGHSPFTSIVKPHSKHRNYSTQFETHHVNPLLLTSSLLIRRLDWRLWQCFCQRRNFFVGFVQSLSRPKMNVIVLVFLKTHTNAY